MHQCSDISLINLPVQYLPPSDDRTHKNPNLRLLCYLQYPNMFHATYYPNTHSEYTKQSKRR